MDVLHARLESLGCPAREWTLVIFAADNGISQERTSHFAPCGSEEIVRAHLSGGRPTARLLKRLGKKEWIIDIGLCEDLFHYDLISKKVSRGSKNFINQDALEPGMVLHALSEGRSTWEIINKTEPDIVGLGEIGVGNTLCAAALVSAATGLPPGILVGPGSIQGEINKKIEIITAALMHRRPGQTDVIDMLARFGGLEIAALTGFICAAAGAGTPLMLDGFVTSAAALLASLMDDRVPQFLFCPNLGLEPGHAHVLERLNLEPIMDLSLNFGEGLASALGLFMAEITMSFYQ